MMIYKEHSHDREPSNFASPLVAYCVAAYLVFPVLIFAFWGALPALSFAIAVPAILYISAVLGLV